MRFHGIILAEVHDFSIFDIFSAGDIAIIGFSRSIVAAIDTDMQIGFTVRASGPEPNLHWLLTDQLMAFPTVDHSEERP
jgi:hypothetical protein